MVDVWPVRAIRFFVSGLLILALGVVFVNTNTWAENAVISNVSLSVPVSCNLATSTEDVPHSATIISGLYQDDIGTTTFNVTCNDASGYSIYAIGYSNEEYGNTKLLASIDGVLDPTHDIITGTATSGNTSNWAMKMTPVAGTYAPTIGSDADGSFSNYHKVPSTYTKVATFASNTDVTIGSSVQSTYAVYVTGTQPAGTYTGKVRYTLVHPASEVPSQPHDTTAGYIGYYPNASGVVDTMNDQTQTIAASTTLWPSNFIRPGYGFVGWSDKFDWELGANDSSGNGTGVNAGYHIYGPNQTISLNTSDYTTKGLSLYAIWVKSQGSLQSWTGCSTLTQGQVTALTDTRDNSTYAVAKLADNKCWMIENLRLNHQYTTSAEDRAKAQGYAGVFTGLAQAEIANFSNSTTKNSLYSIDGSTANTLTGDNLGLRFPRYRNSNTTSPVNNMTTPDANIYSYGNYYTWSAAIANTNDYTSDTATVDGKTSETVGTSICPLGWQLPYGNSTGNGNTPGGFYYLNYKINNNSNLTDATASNLLRSYPNNFLYSGYAYSSSVRDRSSYGRYWSSTAYNINHTYHLSLNSSTVYPGTNTYHKYYGFPTRCVASSV